MASPRGAPAGRRRRSGAPSAPAPARRLGLALAAALVAPLCWRPGQGFLAQRGSAALARRGAVQALLLQVAAPQAASAATRLEGRELGIPTMMPKEAPSIPTFGVSGLPKSKAELERKADIDAKPYFRIVRPTDVKLKKLFAFNLPKIPGVLWGQFDKGGQIKRTNKAAFSTKFAGKKKPPTLISAVPTNKSAAEYADAIRATNFTDTAIQAKRSQEGTGILKDVTTDSYIDLELIVWEKDRSKPYKSHNFVRIFFSPDRQADVAFSVNIPEEQLEDHRDLPSLIFDSVVVQPSQDEGEGYIPEDSAPPELVR